MTFFTVLIIIKTMMFCVKLYQIIMNCIFLRNKRFAKLHKYPADHQRCIKSTRAYTFSGFSKIFPLWIPTMEDTKPQKLLK